MAWQEVLGHDRVVSQFRRALARRRMASTFLFIGPAGIGKRTFALKLAQGLLCDRVPEAALEPCGDCPACKQVTAMTHPDVELLAKPADKAFIPLEMLIGDKEHRMREGLCYNISLKPYSGKRRISIIDDADYFNNEGANCLLKTLEEPPPGAILILIGTSEQRQLPTIRSRCQVIRFGPLSPGNVETLLLRQQLAASPSEVKLLAERCEGSLARAAELADEALREFRAELLDQLARREFVASALAKSAASLVEAAGKEAPAKRARLKQIIVMAVEFYRSLLHGAVVAPAASSDPVDQAVAVALRWWPGQAEAAALCLENSLAMLEAVDANVGALNLLECWLDELATIGRTGRAVHA